MSSLALFVASWLILFMRVCALCGICMYFVCVLCVYVFICVHAYVFCMATDIENVLYLKYTINQDSLSLSLSLSFSLSISLSIRSPMRSVVVWTFLSMSMVSLASLSSSISPHGLRSSWVTLLYGIGQRK